MRQPRPAESKRAATAGANAPRGSRAGRAAAASLQTIFPNTVVQFLTRPLPPIVASRTPLKDANASPVESRKGDIFTRESLDTAAVRYIREGCIAGRSDPPLGSPLAPPFSEKPLRCGRFKSLPAHVLRRRHDAVKRGLSGDAWAPAASVPAASAPATIQPSIPLMAPPSLPEPSLCRTSWSGHACIRPTSATRSGSSHPSFVQ